MRVLYTLLSTLALPAVVLRLWWRGRRLPGYRQRMLERFGWVKLARSEKPLVWVHAVSVGETIAAVPVVEFLLARGDVQVLVTSMTPTGSERVQSLFSDRVLHCYMPYDLPWLLNRFLKKAQPSLALIMETELWPNTIRACRLRQIPVVLLNARLSEKSARGYALFPGLTQELLEGLSHVAVQAREDAQRFMELGLPEDACEVTGSIKFDLTLSEELRRDAANLKDIWSLEGQRLIWIAASTHAGEEEQVLQAFAALKQVQPQALLMLVPRHPDRFEQVAKLCEESGHQWLRRSQGQDPDAEVDILLGDTMGEMLLLYGVADVAYVGGSLVPTGGHNFIEPAAWGLPLLSGPHVFNFAEVARLMLRSGGLTIVNDASSLAKAAGGLMQDGELRQRQGAAAKQVANANRGALAKVQRLVSRYI
jgi:3-deoxy-D-manno-octulosonic-acid transferase